VTGSPVPEQGLHARLEPPRALGSPHSRSVLAAG
jgi:hypothetical protein